MIEWSARFSVSDNSIDTQHQQLFSIMNEIIDGMKSGKCDDRNFIAAILNKLLEYTQYHFREEEIRFNATPYPLKAEHVRAHKDFTKLVAEKIANKDKGIPCLNATEIANIAYNLLCQHILKFDKTYIEYINGTKK